jgi:hypothetical protein
MRDNLPDPSSIIQCSSATPPFRSNTQVHLRPCETDAKQRLNEAARFGVNNAFGTMAAFRYDTADLWPQLAWNAGSDSCISEPGHAMSRRLQGTNRLNPGGKGRVMGGGSWVVGMIEAPGDPLSTYEQNFRRNIVSADARVLGDRA